VGLPNAGGKQGSSEKPVIKKDKFRNIEDIPTALANKHLLGAKCMQNGFFNVESFLFINPYNL